MSVLTELSYCAQNEICSMALALRNVVRRRFARRSCHLGRSWPCAIDSICSPHCGAFHVACSRVQSSNKCKRIFMGACLGFSVIQSFVHGYNESIHEVAGIARGACGWDISKGCHKAVN